MFPVSVSLQKLCMSVNQFFFNHLLLIFSHGPAPTSSQDRYGHSAGMDPRGPPSAMDPRGALPGMDPRAGPGSGMDRGPPHRGGMDHRGMDNRGPPPSMDPRMDRRPGMDPRGK